MRGWPRGALGAAVLALCVGATACGGSSGDGTAAVASAGDGTARSTGDNAKKNVDPEQAGLNFARCMREHGVDMPDPRSDGGLVMVGPGMGPSGGAVERGAAPPPGFEEADKACRHFLEDLVQDGGGPVDPREQDRMLAFAKCMRDHGIDMPDPDFSDGGRVAMRIGGDGSQLDPAKMEAAQKACGGQFGRAGGARP
jgi:hypothetical protein